MLVATHGCDQWKLISEEMGLRNRRDAIIEFLRVKLGSDTCEDNENKKNADSLEKEFLLKLGKVEKLENTDLKDI